MKTNQQGHVAFVIVAIIVICGLIGAGWYVWQSSAGKADNRTGESDTSNQQASESTSEQEGQLDSSRIKNSELASNDFLHYASQEFNEQAGCTILNIKKQLGEFVYANIGANDVDIDGNRPADGSCGGYGGGYGAVYKKVGGSWSKVWQGQEAPECSEVERYRIPKELDGIFEHCIQGGNLVPNTITSS